MHNPDLLILDEPTGGLDPIVQHEFYRCWSTKPETRGKPCFFHRTTCRKWSGSATGWPSSARAACGHENVKNLKARSLRNLEIHFGEDIDRRAFAAVPGLEVVAGQSVRSGGE